MKVVNKQFLGELIEQLVIILEVIHYLKHCFKKCFEVLFKTVLNNNDWTRKCIDLKAKEPSLLDIDQKNVEIYKEIRNPILLIILYYKNILLYTILNKNHSNIVFFRHTNFWSCIIINNVLNNQKEVIL
jgi:hypothetical protein